MLKTRHPKHAASTRHPQLEVPDNVAQESDFWAFLGAVAIPAAGVALLAVAFGALPRLALDLDPAPLIQPGAGGSPVFDITSEQLQAIREGSPEPTPLEKLPPKKSPVQPFPVGPPVAALAERPPTVTVERDEPPGRIEPAPLPPDRAELVPLELEGSAPAADLSDSPHDKAAVQRSVPSTPELPTREPSVAARPTELPASPEPTLQAPVEIQPGPAQPASPQPGPPVDVEQEPSTREPSGEALPTELPVSPEPTRQPGPPVDVEREPPPAEAAPASPPAGLQAPPVPRSGPPAAEPPQVATLPPGPTAPLEQLLPPGRGSGHKLLARLAATESIEGCDSRELPFFRVIEANVYPTRLRPGGRFSHRLVYALCPAAPASQLTAIVTRELRGSAEVVLTDKVDGFRLRPGTWASDEEFAVPPDTEAGRYTVTTTVIFGGRVWSEQTDLLIE